MHGDNGLLSKGSKAKLNTEQANILEQLRMAIYEKNLDIDNKMGNIDYLKSRKIIKEDSTNIGELKRYASIHTDIKLSSIDVEEEEIKYVVDVTKLITKSTTGKGTIETGDVYYISNGNLYYMAENQAKTMLGNVFYEEINNEEASWFNYNENTDGKIEIIGFNFNHIDYEKTKALGIYVGQDAVKINVDKLVIPTKIEGKEVVKVSFTTHISNEKLFMQSTGIIQGIKQIVYPSTVKELGASCIFEDVETIQLPDSLETILENAFYGTQKVQEITIPKSVMYMETPFGGWNEIAIIKIEGKASINDFLECRSDFDCISTFDKDTRLQVEYLGK